MQMGSTLSPLLISSKLLAMCTAGHFSDENITSTICDKKSIHQEATGRKHQSLPPSTWETQPQNRVCYQGSEEYFVVQTSPFSKQSILFRDMFFSKPIHLLPVSGQLQPCIADHHKGGRLERCCCFWKWGSSSNSSSFADLHFLLKTWVKSWFLLDTSIVRTSLIITQSEKE